MSNLHDTIGIGLSTLASYLAGNYIEDALYTHYWALFTVNVRCRMPPKTSLHNSSLSSTDPFYVLGVLPGVDCDGVTHCVCLGRLLL